MKRRYERAMNVGTAVATAAAVLGLCAAPAAAVTPPGPGVVADAPKDAPPKSEFPFKRTAKACAVAKIDPSGVDPSQPLEVLRSLQLDEAHKISTGKGVTVAVIDTGVAKQARLPKLVGGGDYIGDTNGLVDCDAHGTLVAGIIGAAPSESDKLVGVAPDAKIYSLRQSSTAYTMQLPSGTNADDPKFSQSAVDLRALARAIVRAASAGANVINISVTACLAPGTGVDMKELNGALRWATEVKDVVVITAAGNSGDRRGCKHNPQPDPSRPDDPRNWSDVTTLSVPSMFDDYAVSVGFTDPAGSPSPNSLAGPWVKLGAPGTEVASLGPNGKVVTAVVDEQGLAPLAGSSFAAAYVSGVAALIRSRYPEMKADEVVKRLTAHAHSPARGVDNTIGYGVIDPVASLLDSGETPAPKPSDSAKPEQMTLPAAPPAPSPAPRIVALAGSAVLLLVAAVTSVVVSRRRRGASR